jgi:regulator of protease activity HflC (stomatin/prohibitin superfamily)
MNLRERTAWHVNGFLALGVALALFTWGAYGIYNKQLWSALPLGLFVLMLPGFFTVQPNEARVLVFLGRYTGSVRQEGFHFANPVAEKKSVSLKVHNFTSEKLKVNDAMGNPIEIAAVVVWRVVDSAKALFAVENYKEFVAIQSETALRTLASRYPYDAPEGERSLRENPEGIAEELKQELQFRLEVAGVEVLEARLTHLAYAPEIAQAMLRRQQAKAVVAARRLIVEGAVGMVKEALEMLKSEGVVELDEERKAAMVNNLLVALVSENQAQPVLNAGTLYA